jgi:hypothetical protein
MAVTPPSVNGSDPSIQRQVERQTATTLARVEGPVNVGAGTTTPASTGRTRSTAPVVSGSEVIYPQSTTGTSSDAVTITSSTNNDSGDITTVYSTNGQITVNPINQTINQYTTIDSGVAQIVAGDNITITSSAGNGTGIVTISSTGGGGGNGDYGNSNVANYLPTFTGNVGAGNVNVTGTVYANGLSSTGLASLTTLTVSATSNLGAVGNVTITGGSAGQKLTTNGNGVLSWTNDANSSYGNSNVVTLLSAFGSNTITTTGNVSVGNIIGNGQALTNIAGANVSGQVGNALVAGTVYTAAQPNITSVGTLSNLNVSGNSVISGNLTVGGNLVYVNVTTLSVVDPIIDLQTGPNGAAPVANSGKDVGTALNYYDTQARVAFMGWDVSNAEFGLASQASINSEVVTFTNYGNLRVGNIIGNGQALTNIAGANVSGFVPNANVANTAFAVAGANVSGFVPNANVANTAFAVAAANVTGLGNIATINLTGSNSNVLYGNGVFAAVPAPTVAQDITSNGAMSIMLYDGNIKYNNYATVEPSSGNIAGGNISANGNISGGNISATGNITANNLGNISSINIDGSNTNVLYGNGVFAAVAGGNANTGNVTFDDNIVIGTGDEFGGDGLFLAPGNGSIANSAVQYLRVRGGDFPTHIHLDTGNNQYYDQYFGADGRYVKLEANGNVVINADDYLGNSATWTLTIDGNLILAGGNSVIQSIANSSLDPTLPNVSTMTLTPDANYNSQSLVLDPTLPGHIHLRAYAFSNIDEPSANIFLGGEDTAFEITEGANNQAVIHSNGKAWTFGNDGNISSDTLTFTTTFANVKTVEYQTAGVWDLYVEDGITGSNTASSRLNVSFKDNLIDKPQVYIENTKESDGIALRWTFDENGNLNFPRDVAGNTDPYLNIFGGSTPTIQSTDVSLAGPANLAIQSDYLNLSGSTGNRIAIYADNGEIGTEANMVLYTNLANPGNIVSWILDTTGNLTLPNTSSVLANVSITLEANDTGNITGLNLIGDSNANLYAHGNVTIVSDSSNTTATWAFGADGNLTLPGNTFAVNYANGTQVSIGGGGNTGNVTFSDINIIGTGNLKLQPDSANASAYLDIFLTAGPDIHIAGNGETVILGTDDFANVAVNVDGNVSIQAGDANGTHTWTLDTTGNLTLPGNLIIAGNTSVFGTDAALIAPTDDKPLIALSSGANGAVSSLWVEDIGNVGTSNIAAVYANPTSGSKIVRIAVGQNGGNTGPNLWDFGTTGILTLPQGSQISETANTSVNITANANTWAFGVDGNLTVPGSLINDTSMVLSAPAIFNICTIATAGSGYNTGSSLKATTGGSGTGMTVGIGYGLSNQLTSVSVVNPGTGYVNGDVITVSEGTGGTFVITKYNVLANQTNNNTVQTDLIFANNTVTLPIYGEMATDASMTLTTNLANTGNTRSWTFGDDGNLTIPGTSGGFIKTASNASIGIAAMDNGTNNPAQLLSINVGNSNATSIISAYATNATIQTNASGNINTWAFDNAGNLTLPANTFAINYANGTQVSLGGGNVTWAQLEDKDGNSGPTLIALGQNAGLDGQGNAAIAIGLNAGQGGQGDAAITIGQDAGGNTTQGANAVAIGRSAGFDAQGEYSVAIGQNAGSNIQGLQSVAVGLNAGSNTQGNLAVGIGVSAGFTNQGDAAVAIGPSAGYSTQRNEAVAIGAFAGETTQGTSAVAIGSGAGRTSQGNNSIILNATGANLNQTTANTFTVSPVRNDTSNIAEVMFYNTTSKEVTYGNTISVAGNITGANFIGNLANGNSDVSIPAANGNINFDVAGNANVVVMTGTGANITGTLNVTGNITGNTNGFTIGYLNIPQVAAANATLALTDAGKHYYSTTAGNFTLTVPTNANAAFATGTAISIVVQAAGNILVNAAAGVTLYMAGNSTAANRVVGGYGMATLMKVATDTWFINGTGVA